MPEHTSSSAPPPHLLAIPWSEVAFIVDRDDARRLARELEPAASDGELQARAEDILAGRLLVVRRELLPALDAAASDSVPRLASLAEVG